MRSRNIKPGFFKNPELCEVSPLARILFTGLWCMADREGLVEYRPKLIKIEILPCESEPVEKLLDELRSCSVIDYYCRVDEAGAEIPEVIHVVNFLKHQNPHKQEKPSELKKLIESREITRQTPNKNSTRPADSLILNPDSLILIPDCSNSIGGEKKTSRPTKIRKDFAITEKMREWAVVKKGYVIDLEVETEKFINYWLGKGKAMVDWEATWRSWIIKAVDFQKKKSPYPQNIPCAANGFGTGKVCQ